MGKLRDWLSDRQTNKLLRECDKLLGDDKRIPSHRLDALYDDAIKVVLKTGQASASMLQRKMNLGYRDAALLIDKMEREGIVSPFDGSNPRKILVGNAPSVQSNVSDIMLRVDNMEGLDFEFWCADLLRKIGFSGVEVTRGSGDQGVDVLAEKDGIHYAIQCKCYSSDLGNKPVQEVNTGKAVYHCQIGAVMTNRHFTAGAKEAAQATGVLLWDRDWIQSKLERR